MVGGVEVETHLHQKEIMKRKKRVKSTIKNDTNKMGTISKVVEHNG
jgi:hypothetical protein